MALAIHLLRAALRGHAPAALLRRAGDRLLHRHRRRPSGLRQRVVRVLSARLARHHGRAQSLARAIERGGAAARHPHPIAGRRRRPARRPIIWSRISTASRPRSKSHARAAQSEFGKRSQAMTMPVTTLASAVRAACPGRHRFPQDRRRGRRARGAGRRRLAALPAQGRGAGGAGAGHAGAGLGGLGAAAHWATAIASPSSTASTATTSPRSTPALAERLAAAPASFDGVTPFRQFKPALDDASHPDHGLARLLAGADMVRLPLLPSDAMAERLIDGLDPAELDRPAHARRHCRGPPAAVRDAAPRRSGRQACSSRPTPRSAISTAVRSQPTPFRAACGRISASYAW